MGKSMDGTAPAKQRMAQQDIAKGIAILVVLVVHTMSLPTVFYNRFMACLGYVLPFFFFMSGYNYRPHRASYAENIRKRARQLIVPFLVYTIGVGVVMGAYLILRGEATLRQVSLSIVQTLLTRYTFVLFGVTIDYSMTLYVLMAPFWFLQYMMVGYLIFYAVADYALENMGRFASVNGCLIGVTMILEAFGLHLPWGIDVAPAIASFMLFGALFGQHRVLHSGTTRTRYVVLNAVVAFAICLVLGLMHPLAGMMIAGRIAWQLGPWEVPLTLLMSILSSYTLNNVGRLIDRIPVVNGLLGWIGRNTLPILLLHQSFAQLISDVTGFKKGSNMMEEGTVETMDWSQLALYVLMLILVCVYVWLWGKCKSAIMRKRSASK